MEDRLQGGADKWRTELFKPQPELWEGGQIEPVGSIEKWETVALGQWMQKAAWNWQNGDKNDAGTASHYPGNYYVDCRLLDTGR
jgi:hypothetical protein